MSLEQQRIEELESLVCRLMSEISELKSKLARLESPKKDSSNSSVPPSQDPFRAKRTESLREKSGRKPGGQAGHEGTFLQMCDTPDNVEDHHPDTCAFCGRDLSDIPAEFTGKRQIIDIPPIVPIITEHRIYRKACTCGRCNQSVYPDGVHSTVCYGENLTALTAYFHSRQYIPYDRMGEMFKDIFGVYVSKGALVNLVQSFAHKAGFVYEEIRCRILRSSVVGADETGVCVAGKNHWAWTFQDESLTYITVDSSRGKAAVKRIFKDGLPRSVLVHDCWKPYFGTPAQAHQICTAHLLRELKYLQKLYPDDEWPATFKKLLKDALQLKRELIRGDYLRPIREREMLEQRLDELLNRDMNPKDEKMVAFKNRMIRCRQYLFLFLYRYDVSPDNNGSERAVRTFKVKQKVSGLFRSMDGAQAFAVIRSVIDTTIKNSQNVFQALALIARG